MKKPMIILVAVCLTMVFSGVGLALEADFSGSYYVEGIYNSNPNLSKNDLATYYRQMRLRLQTDFKVHEKLRLTTRFDALEKVWNTDDSAFSNNDDAENIDFDRAYMSIITKIGLFQLGRQEGVTWGTTWADDEDDTDRIKYILPLDAPAGGKLIFALIWEKTTENDTNTSITSGKDNDKYYFGTIYKREKYDTGLLFGYYDFNYVPDPAQRNALNQFSAAGYTSGSAIATVLGGYSAALVADGGVPGANVTSYLASNPNFATLATSGQGAQLINVIASRGATSEASVWLISPYFQGKFNKVGIQAELDYVFGDVSYSDDGYSEPDHDVKAYSYFVEGTMDVGPLTFQAGWAHRSGDGNDYDTDEKGMGYFAPGLDWEKMFILSSDYHGLNTSLAGIGNHVGAGFVTYSRPLLDGFRMPYIGVDYAATDDVTLTLLAAKSIADDTATGWDDDQGVEVDGKVTWNPMDNLEIQGVAAYLSAGDYWKQGVAATQLEDIYTFFSRITLTF